MGWLTGGEEYNSQDRNGVAHTWISFALLGANPLALQKPIYISPLSLSLGSREDLPLLPNRDLVSSSLVSPSMILGSQKVGLVIQGKKKAFAQGIFRIQRTVGATSPDRVQFLEA